MSIRRWINRLVGGGMRGMSVALLIIAVAAALIELLSLIQYRYAHRLIEEELDYRVESELTLKASRVRGILKSNEKMVRNYLDPVQTQIVKPDNVYHTLYRLVETNDGVMSSFLAFVPGYYPSREHLFEPCAFRRGDSILTTQLAGERHDYTRREFYSLAVEQGLSCWTDPYVDSLASGQQVVTHATPLTDAGGQVVGTFGIDLSTKDIIDTLNTRHMLPSTFFLLLTEDGRLISRPDASHTSGSDVDAVVKMINDSTCQRKFSSSSRSKIITFNDKEKGKGYAYYAFMMGKPRWQVVMVCYDKEVYSKLNTMRRNFMLLMLGVFSLLGFILYRVRQYLKQLHRSRLSKERADSQLSIARTIQSEMLPRHAISRRDVDIDGKQVTALEVGGDLYDYLLRDEKLYFCIGDVSGKGVPSSLVMAVVHSQFRTLVQHASNPAYIMQSINEVACEDNETNMFVTLLVGVLDLPTGRLRYCNAGHDAPLLVAGGVKPLAVNANLPVGIFADFKYNQQEVQLPADSTLLLYTDGLTEAADKEHHLFGLQRIIDTAQSALEQGRTAPAQLMETLYNAAQCFVDGAEQSDDLTMLAIHYHRPDDALVLDEAITLTNDVSQVKELNQFVSSVAERLNLELPMQSQLMLAVEEAVVNVMNYAYPIGTQGDVTIEARATDACLSFIITDSGKAFDPTERSNVDTSLSAEDRPIGGLGILLVRSLMDSINYERHDGKNVLTLKKAFGETE